MNVTKENIKVILFRVNSDGDFYWNLKSFPRERDDDGYLKDFVLIYLKNPTLDDIKTVVKKIIEEFRESFSTHRELLFEVRDDICQKLNDSINVDENGKLKKFDYDGEVTSFCEVGWSSGNYDMDLKLMSYVEKEVTYANCNEKEVLTFIDVAYENLL